MVQTKEKAMPADNWEHRSAKMKCHSCMWFVLKGEGRAANSIGRCRRRAPSMNGFPVVFETDWCGDHKLDEIKAGDSGDT